MIQNPEEKRKRKCADVNVDISDPLFHQQSPVYWEMGFSQWHRQTHTHTTDKHSKVDLDNL